MRKDEGFLSTSVEISTQSYWDSTYGTVALPTPPSAFAHFASEYIGDRVGAVIDLGCGNGRDTGCVGGGKPTLGIDYSNVAVVKNREHWKGKPNLSFLRGDVSDAQSMLRSTKSFILDANGPVALYSRFFIHAIDDVSERSLLDYLNAAMPKKSILLFEFRTHLDVDLAKIFRGHYRRFVNPDRFVERMSEGGLFSLSYRSEGQGLAKYKDEDPHVARVIFEAK